MTEPTPRKPFAARAADLTTDGAALIGSALIVDGVRLIYAPAGLVVAGAFLLGGAWLVARRTGAG